MLIQVISTNIKESSKIEYIDKCFMKTDFINENHPLKQFYNKDFRIVVIHDFQVKHFPIADFHAFSYIWDNCNNHAIITITQPTIESLLESNIKSLVMKEIL